MAVLKDILNKAINNITPKSMLLPTPKIIPLTKKILRKFNSVVDMFKATDAVELRNIFSEAVQNNNYNQISKQHWKRASWLLWDKFDNELPFAANKLFLKRYLNYCKNNITSRSIKNLISAYLNGYEYKMHGQLEVSEFIRNQLHSGKISRSLYLWKVRDDLHRVFDHNKQFEINADDYLSSNLSAEAYLEDIGLEGQLEASGYALSLFEAVTYKAKTFLINPDLSERYFNRLVDLAIMKGPTLRYPINKYQLIEALLRPWINNSVAPEMRRLILSFLLKFFHDPRTSKGRINWVGVSEQSKKIIRKWLAGETLEQFFDIIDQTANDKHWKYRKDFWRSYFDDGFIDEACMAAGRDSKLAIRSLSLYGNDLITSDLRGVGVKNNHSALIFKVGDLTISEWSHDGKCRVWLSNNKKSPELYKDWYEPNELKSDSEHIVKEYKEAGISHHGSPSYLWQGKLSAFIYHHTGIRMPAYKYMRE